MQTTAEGILVPGAAMEGGYYAGRILINDEAFGLVVAPKDAGEHARMPWNGSLERVVGAASWNDGPANTRAMAEAGSEFAVWALGLRIGDFADWYVPSLDEAQLALRNLGALYTAAAVFQDEREQAFEPDWYWTSTQFLTPNDPSDAAYAWIQYFDTGNQLDDHKGTRYRARAVRRFKI